MPQREMRAGRLRRRGRQAASRTSLMMMNGRPYSSNASDMFAGGGGLVAALARSVRWSWVVGFGVYFVWDFRLNGHSGAKRDTRCPRAVAQRARHKPTGHSCCASTQLLACCVRTSYQRQSLSRRGAVSTSRCYVNRSKGRALRGHRCSVWKRFRPTCLFGSSTCQTDTPQKARRLRCRARPAAVRAPFGRLLRLVRRPAARRACPVVLATRFAAWQPPAEASRRSRLTACPPPAAASLSGIHGCAC
eukprot:6498160-Prymnesium_polylepis.1